jgi:GntR family transcriptional regulator
MHSSFVISMADGRAMYLQLIEQVRQRVAIGDWPSGHELPSIRELAAELSVSVITIKRAYLELEREGIIVTRHGRGSFVADTNVVTLDLFNRDLDRHLEAAARLAAQLRIDPETLELRLRQATNALTQDVS